MKAIILAAGRGSRMKNLTSDKPKCLVKLHGKPLLEWQLDSMNKSGISEIAVVTGYKNEMLSSYNLVEFHNSYWASTQMVSSLACASEWLENDKRNDFILSGNEVFTSLAKDYLDFIKEVNLRNIPVAVVESQNLKKEFSNYENIWTKYY